MTPSRHVELLGGVPASGPAAALEEGRDIVLFAPVSAGDRMPPGTLLDDRLGPEDRRRIDTAATDQLARWRSRRRPLEAAFGLPLSDIWEIELLADVFIAVVRVVEGVLRVVDEQGVRSASLRGVDPDLADCLTALLAERGVEIADRSVGAPPPALLRQPVAPAGTLSRIVGRTGLPARSRGGVAVWSYWHLSPVVERLAKQPASRPILDPLNLDPRLGRRFLAEALLRNGWWPRPSLRARRRSRQRLADALDAAGPLGTDAGPLERLLDTRALALLGRRAGDTWAHHEAALGLLRNGRVHTCLLPFDADPHMRAIVHAARARGVRVVAVQHGAPYPDALQNDLAAADLAAVWSLGDARRLEGRAHGSVVVTGNPAGRASAPSVAAARPARTVVLVESVSRLSATTDVRVPFAHLHAALDALEQARPGVEVVVRPHPSEQAIEAIGAAVDAHPGCRASVSFGGPIEAVFASADLCLGAVSTATLQAAVEGLRVVMLNVSARPSPWPLNADSGVPYATSTAELGAAIPATLAAPEQPGLGVIRDALGIRPDGEAAQAVSCLVRRQRGAGRSRAATPVTLRPAQADDAERLLAWRNDEQTRAVSFDQEPIPWESHVAWLERRLADPGCLLWIGELDGGAVGQIRLDREDEQATVALAVAPEARGRGLGLALLEAAEVACPWPVRAFAAEVVPGNAASLKTFERAGYDVTGQSPRATTLRRPIAPLDGV